MALHLSRMLGLSYTITISLSDRITKGENMNICPLILHIQHLSLKYTRVALYFGKATKDPHTLMSHSMNHYV